MLQSSLFIFKSWNTHLPVVGGYLAFIGYFCVEAGVALCIGHTIMVPTDWVYLFNEQSLVLALPVSFSLILSYHSITTALTLHWNREYSLGSFLHLLLESVRMKSCYHYQWWSTTIRAFESSIEYYWPTMCHLQCIFTDSKLFVNCVISPTTNNYEIIIGKSAT